MAQATSIEWATDVWNPTTGCDQISEECDHCYAKDQAARLKRFGQAAYQNDGDPRTSGPGFALTMHPGRLDQPAHWRKPRRVFVNSMSDLFHKGVEEEFIRRVWWQMALAPQHDFLILTKRPKRMRNVVRAIYENPQQLALAGVPFPLPNVWLGTSIGLRQYVWRADLLRETPAAVRFISAEPLLGPLVPVSDRRMGDNPVYGGIRGSGVQGGPGRRVGDSAGRHDLARGGPQGESLDTGHEADPLRTEAGGEQAPERLFAGPGDVRGEARARAGAPAGLDSLQSRGARVAGPDDQPQERGQGRQSAGELGAGDLQGAGASRSRDTGSSRVARPGGRGQSSCDADLGAGGRDEGAVPARRDTGGVGDGLRRGVSDGLEDHQERALGPWLDLTGISWLIVGGESGPKHRPFDHAWARDLRDACYARGGKSICEPQTAFFMKQMSGPRPGSRLEDLPEDLRIREFPTVRP